MLGDIAGKVGNALSGTAGKIAVGAATSLIGGFFGVGTPQQPASAGTTSIPGLMSPSEAEDANKNFSAGGGGAETAKAETSKDTSLNFAGDDSLGLANVWNQLFLDLVTTETQNPDERRKSRR